jgi:hypothetical protein
MKRMNQDVTRGSFTTIPIEQDQNWVRLPRRGERICGLTRGFLYMLVSSGAIRSVSLRRPHHKRGVRLIYRPSLHEFLNKLDREQNGKHQNHNKVIDRLSEMNPGG